MPTLREKIAQMFLVGVGARELTNEERMMIERYSFGGFILFGHNCCDPVQILSLTQALWDASKGFPPLIAIDQEGGRVHRLPKPFAHFPRSEERRVGKEGRSRWATDQARNNESR